MTQDGSGGVTRNYSLSEMDRRSVFHPATPIAAHLKTGPMIATSAKGIRVKDSEGHEYLDFGAGLWCVNIGYGRAELADAAAATMKSLSYFPLFFSSSNEPVIRLADRILTMLREEAGAGHMSKVFFGNSGSDANDTNYKLVRYYNNLRGRPEKKKIISRLGAYHGSTLASASLTGILDYHKAFDLPLGEVRHLSCPHFYRFSETGESEEAFTDRMIAEIEDCIASEGAETVAAFIAEPIMGTGGVIVPPRGYFKKLQAVFDKNDILLIVDEVITGFGRTGHAFGTGLYGLKPDFITLAKGLTSAYFPMSASVVSERVWEVLRDTSPQVGAFMHGFTYSGHPVGGAVAMANLDIVENERMVENAATVGAYFKQGLRDRLKDEPYVGDIRGEGLMIGVEFAADRAKRTFFPTGSYPHRLVQRHAAQRGLMIRALPFGEVTSFSPPLCLTKAEADEGADRFMQAVQGANAELLKLVSS